jgi:hypothetical protein
LVPNGLRAELAGSVSTRYTTVDASCPGLKVMLVIEPASWPVLENAWPKVVAAICCALLSNRPRDRCRPVIGETLGRFAEKIDLRGGRLNGPWERARGGWQAQQTPAQIMAFVEL